MVATCYNNIGSVLADQGDLDRASIEYDKALEIQERKAPNSLTVSMCYNNVSSVLWEKGDFEGAMQQFSKARGTQLFDGVHVLQ